MRNFRDPHPLDSRSVFHANPSSDTSQLLLPGIRQTKRSTIPIMVNYNYSNVINLPKYFSKRDKLKTKCTKSKQCIHNIFNTDKLIFVGSTDIEKEVERNILKILTQMKSEDKLLDFENICENVNSQLKQNEENDKNNKVKSKLGVQKKNKHETNLMKLKEAIMYFKNKDNTGNGEKVITNVNEHKSVESIKDKKQIEELQINDKFFELFSNYNNKYIHKENKYLKSVYRTRSTRIKIAADRKQFEKRRHEQLKEKRQKIISSKTNLKAKIYNKTNFRNFNKPAKNLFEQYNTVKNDKIYEKPPMFTEYIGENGMDIKDDDSIEKLKKNKLICYETPLLQPNDNLLCKSKSNQFQAIPINTPLFNNNSSNSFQSYAQNNVFEHEDKLTILKERNVENKKFIEENLTRDSRGPSPLNKNIDRLKKMRTRSTSPRICYRGELQTNTDKKDKGDLNKVLNDGSCLPVLSTNRSQFLVKNKNLNRVCEERSNLKHRHGSHSSDKKDVNIFAVPRDCDSLNIEEIERKSLLLSKHRMNNRKKNVSFGDNKGEENENFRLISQKLNTRNSKDVTNTDIKTMKENTINTINIDNSESISNSTPELNTGNREHSITNIEKTVQENTISINNENCEITSNSIELNTRNIVENIDKNTEKENTINVENKNNEHRSNSSVKLNTRKKNNLVTSIDNKFEENSNNNNRSTSPHTNNSSTRETILTNEDKNNKQFKPNTVMVYNLKDVITVGENTNDQLIIRYNSPERYSLIKRKEFVIKNDDIYNKVLKNEHNEGRPNSDTYSLINSTEWRNNIHETCDEISNVSLNPVKFNVNDRQKLVNNLEENPGSVGNLVSIYKKSRNSTPHVNNGIDVVQNAEREEEKEWNEISNLNNLSVKCDKTNQMDLVKQERENTNTDLFLCPSKISVAFDIQGKMNFVINEDEQLAEDTKALNLKYNTQILENVDFDMEKDQTIQENIHNESTNLVKKYSKEIDLETMVDKHIKENPVIQLLMKKTLDHLNVSGEMDFESLNFDLHHTNNKTHFENTYEVNNNTKVENLGKAFDVKEKLETNVDNTTNKEISNPDKLITKINVETNQEGVIKPVYSIVRLKNMGEYFNDELNNTEIVTTKIKENIPYSNDCTEHLNYEPSRHACIGISENLRNQIVIKGASNGLIYCDERQNQFANNEVLSHNKQVDEIFQQNLVTYKLDSVPLQDYTRDRSSSQNNLLRCSEPSDKFIKQLRIKKVQQRLNSPEKSNVIDGGKILEDKFNDSKSNSLKQQCSSPHKKSYLTYDSVNVKGLIKQKTNNKNTKKIVQIDLNTVTCRSVFPRTNYLNNDSKINHAFDNVNKCNEYYHQTSYGDSNKMNNNNHMIKEYEEKEYVQIIRARSNSPKKTNVADHLLRSSGSLEHTTPNNGFNMNETALKCTRNTSSPSRSCSSEKKRRLTSLKNPKDSSGLKKAERPLYENTTSKRKSSVVNKFDVLSSELSSKTVSCEDKLPVTSFSSAVSYNSFQYKMNNRRSRVDDFASQSTEYVSSTVGYSTETDTIKATNTSMEYTTSTNSGQNPCIDNIVSTMVGKTNCEIPLESKTISSEVETSKIENREKLNDLEIKTNEKKNVLKQKVKKQMEDGKILNEKLKSKETSNKETRLKVVKKNIPKVKLNTLKSSLNLRNMKTKDETNGSKISNMHQSSDNQENIKIEQNSSSSSKVTSQISKKQPDKKTILKQNNKPKFPYLRRQSKTFKPDDTIIEKIKIIVKQREMISNRVVDKTTENPPDITKLNKNPVLKDVPTNSGDDNNNKNKFYYLRNRSKSSNTKSVPEKKTPLRNRSTSPNLKTPPGLKLTQELLDNNNKVVSINLDKEHSLIKNGEHNAHIEVVTFQPVKTLIRKGAQPSTRIVYKRIQSPQNILKLVKMTRSSTTIKQFSSNQSDNCGQLTDSTCLENEQKLTAKGLKKLTNGNEQKQFQSKIPILRKRPAEIKTEL